MRTRTEEFVKQLPARARMQVLVKKLSWSGQLGVGCGSGLGCRGAGGMARQRKDFSSRGCGCGF